MSDRDLKDRIVARLAAGASTDDLVLELCETRNLTWEEARLFISRLELEHEQVIAGRRLPLLLMIALVIFFGGLALVLYDTYIIVILLQTDLQPVLTFPDLETHLRLIFDLAIAPVGGVILGSAMMLGSMLGMRRAWVPLIEHFLDRHSARARTP